jgi:hypothetical protein
MKYLAIIAMTTMLASGATPVKAGDRLTEIESAFVGITAATAMAVVFCDANGTKDAVPKLADRLGVDEGILVATREAYAVYAGSTYERANLIPSVTRLFRETANGVDSELQQNKKKTCANWIDALRKIGTIE